MHSTQQTLMQKKNLSLRVAREKYQKSDCDKFKNKNS